MNSSNNNSAKEIVLSARGLSNIIPDKIESDFYFQVGKKKYPCNRILAQYISPSVSRLFQTDATIDHFDINIIDDTDCLFNNIINLVYGRPFTMNKTHMFYYLEVARILGNAELVDLILQGETIDLNIDNVIASILQKLKIGVPIRNEETFAAENFYQINELSLALLPSSALWNILNNSSLKLKNEATLLNFILNLIETKGSDYRCLLECLCFENLTNQEIDHILTILNPDDISAKLWLSLRKKLTDSAQEINTNNFNSNDRYIKLGVTFKPEKGKANGIISHLSRETNGNVHQNGVVLITALTVGSSKSCYQPYVVADLKTKDFYGSNNNPNNWINFEFVKNHVFLTHYTLRSYPRDPGFSHLKSWVVEGSNDSNNWAIIDKRTENNDLNGNLAKKTFECQNPMDCKNVRIRINGVDHHGGHYIELCAVEFYGTLYQL